jgi:hypothetical protein
MESKKMAKARKSMRDFIRDNKSKLIEKIIEIHEDLKALKSFSREEIRVMVINEPELTEWARREGVRIA